MTMPTCPLCGATNGGHYNTCPSYGGMNKKTPHKHAATIKAWADGATIQFYNIDTLFWQDITDPTWWPGTTYRVKPERVTNAGNLHQGWSYSSHESYTGLNVKAMFDGETGKLKSVELLT